MIRARSRTFTSVLLSLSLVGIWGASTAHAVTTPSLTVADVSAVEGDAGIATIPVPVDLSAPSAVTVKVPYSVIVSSDGTADAADAKLKVGTLSFLAGVTSMKVGVASIGDTVIEPDQHVLVVLGAPVGGTATIADGTGLVTLTDDDANGVNPGIEASVGDIVVTEADAGSHRGYIPVLLSRPATVLTKVGFAVDCLSASVLKDISIAKSGTLSFSIGQRFKAIPFSISADLLPEEIETITQHISSQLSSVTVLDNRGDAVVMNDDDGSLPPVSASPEPGFVTESLPSGSAFDQLTVGQIDQLTLTPSGGQPADTYSDPGSGNSFSVTEAFSMSRDGRFVAFSSERDDLVSGDTNGMGDMFVRDRDTGTTERVSQHPDGSQITVSDVTSGVASLGRIRAGAISADGRYVVYQSMAAVVPGDVVFGELPDVYLFDRVAQTTELVSQTSSGAWLHGAGSPSISANGRYVSFAVGSDLYVRDRSAGTTTAVFHAASLSGTPVMSANGRYVVVPMQTDTCYKQELILIDLQDGAAERVDVTDNGEGGSLDNVFGASMFKPSISEDGRFVAFKSTSWNLVPGRSGPNPQYTGPVDLSLLHTYVRDRTLLSTTMVGRNPDGVIPPPNAINSLPAISGDGRLVAVSNTTGQGQVFDRTAATEGSVGVPYSYSNIDTVFGPTAISGDGRYIAYSSSHYVVYGHVIFGDGFVQRLR